MSRRNGVWEFTNRYGNISRKNEGPFQQVQGNMQSLRQYMVRRLGNYDPLVRCQYACAVAMPDCRFRATVVGIDVVPEILVDAKQSWNLDSLVNQAFGYWRQTCIEKHGFEGGRLTDAEIDKMANLLRGDFHFVPSMKDTVERTVKELCALTAEQYEVLESLFENPRTMVSGVAGAGKTLIAMEQARRAYWEGKSVLYLCYNHNIAQYVQYQFEKDRVYIEAVTLHAFMMRTCGIEWSPDLSQHFYEKELPATFMAAEDVPAYDLVIIDEGQDLLTDTYLECVDRIVRDGLGNGTWAIYDALTAFLSAQATKAVQDMMDRESFPTFSDDIPGQLQKKDLMTVTQELYKLDARIFYKLKPIQEKSLLGFINLLLQSEERENMLDIIESIVSLTPEQRKGFSDILKRTQLGNIIDTIQFIEDRYKVVEALKQVVFDYTDYANERDHVQKIVEQHYWLFGEQYNLVTADQRMQKALANYLNILYGSDAPDATLNPDQEEMRRMDIFLCGARKTEDSVGDEIQENLVIELKAPKVVLTKKVLRQIEDYMDFVRKQPQFNTQLCRWRFIAVCNNVDDDVRARYATNQTKGKKGLVFSVENYELYALTWADVFKSFELRHSFLLKKLKIDQEAIEKDISQQLGNSTGREAVNNLTALALPVSMISG